MPRKARKVVKRRDILYWIQQNNSAKSTTLFYRLLLTSSLEFPPEFFSLLFKYPVVFFTPTLDRSGVRILGHSKTINRQILKRALRKFIRKAKKYLEEVYMPRKSQKRLTVYLTSGKQPLSIDVLSKTDNRAIFTELVFLFVQTLSDELKINIFDVINYCLSEDILKKNAETFFKISQETENSNTDES